MKKALRNKTEARPQRSVGKQRRRHIASLQHQEQTTLSYTGHKTVSGITHTIAGSSSDNFSPSSAVSDRKKLSSPANNSIKAINERIARLSMGNQLPSSKLPRRLQSSQSQQTRLLPILPLQSRATKSETTINNNKNNNNVTRNIRPRSKTITMAAAATENDRQSLRKQNNGNFHSIWRTRKCQRTSEDNDKYHNEKDSCYGHQTTSGNDHLVEAAQSRLKNLLLARERQLDIHEQLKQTFGDIVDQQEESGTELIQQIRLHLDEQALQIQNLERLLAQERSRKGYFRRKFELEKQVLLQQQEEQFDALKSKYRVGLERIVDRWLSNEAAEQEIWMDQIRQQADDRVALVEERWMERAADLQAELRQYQDQNL